MFKYQAGFEADGGMNGRAASSLAVLFQQENDGCSPVLGKELERAMKVGKHTSGRVCNCMI